MFYFNGIIIYISTFNLQEDFKLMCTNAMTYNQHKSIYYKTAKHLLHVGLKLTRPKKLKKLLTAFPGIANIPPSQLGFDINQHYYGKTSNKIIIENYDRSSDTIIDSGVISNQPNIM